MARLLTATHTRKASITHAVTIRTANNASMRKCASASISSDFTTGAMAHGEQSEAVF
jgi:hypothetical protein